GAEPHPKREQVDRRLYHRGERGRRPVALEQRDLPGPHRGQTLRLEPAQPHPPLGGAGLQPLAQHAHSTVSPVSTTNTSSRLLGRWAPGPSCVATELGISSARSTVTAGPLRRGGAP